MGFSLVRRYHVVCVSNSAMILVGLLALVPKLPFLCHRVSGAWQACTEIIKHARPRSANSLTGQNQEGTHLLDVQVRFIYRNAARRRRNSLALLMYECCVT